MVPMTAITPMPPTSVIDWLRHGETQGGNRFRGRTDDPLTPAGWRQMWMTAANSHEDARHAPENESLPPDLHADQPVVPGPRDARARPWDRIIASPLIRCADFGRALSQRLDLPLSLDPRLVELDFGAWEGRSAADLMVSDAEALGRFWADPVAHSPPGGESLPAFQARVLAAWQDLTEQALTYGERLLVVSHGGVIRVIICTLLDHPLGRLLELEVGHASLTRVGLDRTPMGIRAQRLDPDSLA